VVGLSPDGAVAARPVEGSRAAFVEEAGLVFAKLGYSRTAARVLGVLLIEEDSDASDLAGYLGVAKSSMSVALRHLEEAGLIVRFHRPGQRRDRIRLSPDAFARSASAQIRVFDDVAQTAVHGLSVVGDDPVLRSRLEYVRDLHAFLSAEFSRLLERFRAGPRTGREGIASQSAVDVRTVERSALRHRAQRAQPATGGPQGGHRHRHQSDRSGGQTH
jgi:DNA-binding MarR family transcriptional regulator